MVGQLLALFHSTDQILVVVLMLCNMMKLELNSDLELEDAVTSIHKMPNGEEQEFMYWYCQLKPSVYTHQA